VTLKFDKAPLTEVLAEITRQSGVTIELGPLATHKVSIDTEGIAALAAIDAVGATLPTPLAVIGAGSSVFVAFSPVPATRDVQQGRVKIMMSEQGIQRHIYRTGEARKSTLRIDAMLCNEPGLSLHSLHVLACFGNAAWNTDRANG
jgi:hypothetical protein